MTGEAFAAVYRRVMGDSPAYRRPMPGPDAYATLVAKAADALRVTGAFGEPEEWRFEKEQFYTRDEWLDVVPTYGSNTRLPAETMREILAGLGAAVDAAGGGFTMRYTAVVGTRRPDRHRLTARKDERGRGADPWPPAALAPPDAPPYIASARRDP